MGKMVQVVVRIPVEIDAEAHEIARKQCRSYSSVLRQAIFEWLILRKGLETGSVINQYSGEAPKEGSAKAAPVPYIPVLTVGRGK